jgi:hypothetical protein
MDERSVESSLPKLRLVVRAQVKYRSSRISSYEPFHSLKSLSFHLYHIMSQSLPRIVHLLSLSTPKRNFAKFPTQCAHVHSGRHPRSTAKNGWMSSEAASRVPFGVSRQNGPIASPNRSIVLTTHRTFTSSSSKLFPARTVQELKAKNKIGVRDVLLKTLYSEPPTSRIFKANGPYPYSHFPFPQPLYSSPLEVVSTYTSTMKKQDWNGKGLQSKQRA